MKRKKLIRLIKQVLDEHTRKHQLAVENDQIFVPKSAPDGHDAELDPISREFHEFTGQRPFFDGRAGC